MPARLAPPARLVGPQLVHEPPGGDPDQPSARVPRPALPGPLPGGGEQRFLYGVLGRVEVPVAAYDRAEDLRRQRAQQVLDGYGRISGPVRHASTVGPSLIGWTTTGYAGEPSGTGHR